MIPQSITNFTGTPPLDKTSDFGSRLTPLSPVTHMDTTTDPIIQIHAELIRIGNEKIVSPSDVSEPLPILFALLNIIYSLNWLKLYLFFVSGLTESTFQDFTLCPNLLFLLL